MKYRQATYYTFQPHEERWKIEQMADSLGEAFIGSHFEKKWIIEYYFTFNNQAFLEHIAEFDTPSQIHEILFKQLEEYIERTPVEPSVSFLQDPIILTSKWLENTLFICKKAYKETDDEVYNEVIRWCERRKLLLDTRHGLNNLSNDPKPPIITPLPITQKYSVGSPRSENEDTQRKARQAVTIFENKIEELITRERGKSNPLNDKQIVTQAIQFYCSVAVGRNLGADEKSLIRYIKDLKVGETAKKYGRQLVGQIRKRK